MSAMRRLRWALMMLVLPLLLMGWSSLQGWRADSVLEEAQAMRQWLAEPDDRWLEALSVRERKEVITEQDAQTYGKVKRGLNTIKALIAVTLVFGIANLAFIVCWFFRLIP